jgi:dephospho-CoA kinase
MIIHVVGKIGSGKSTISHYIESEYGLVYLETDEIIKRLYNLDVFLKWVDENAPQIKNPDGTFDRSLFRSILFRNKALNLNLLKLTLPIVAEWIKDIVDENPDQNYVIESFFVELVEKVTVDQIIIVKSKEIETLIKRIKGRDKRSYSETLAIVTFQNEYINRNYYDNRELDDQIRHKLTVVYNEDGMLEKTFETIDEVMENIGLKKIES